MGYFRPNFSLRMMCPHLGNIYIYMFSSNLFHFNASERKVEVLIFLNKKTVKNTIIISNNYIITQRNHSYLTNKVKTTITIINSSLHSNVKRIYLTQTKTAAIAVDVLKYVHPFIIYF